MFGYAKKKKLPKPKKLTAEELSEQLMGDVLGKMQNEQEILNFTSPNQAIPLDGVTRVSQKYTDLYDSIMQQANIPDSMYKSMASVNFNYDIGASWDANHGVRFKPQSELDASRIVIEPDKAGGYRIEVYYKDRLIKGTITESKFAYFYDNLRQFLHETALQPLWSDEAAPVPDKQEENIGLIGLMDEDEVVRKAIET